MLHEMLWKPKRKSHLLHFYYNFSKPKVKERDDER